MTTTTTTTTTKSYAPVVVALIMEQDPGRRNPAGSGALSGTLLLANLALLCQTFVSP